MKDYNKLLETIKIGHVLERVNKQIKKLGSVKKRIFAGVSLFAVILPSICNFILKEPDIPAPQLELKWEYLSAYDYNYIIELNNIKVVKKAKDIIENLIAVNKNENVIVGVLIIRNNKDEYPENLRVNLERIQDGQVFEEEIKLKTVTHNDYIMIPLFITHKFPEEFVNNKIPSSITKKEIFDAIDTRVVYNPISVKYEKARFWEWNKEEILIVEESSDVFSEWESTIKIDEENEQKEAVYEEDIEEGIEEDTKVYIPRIYKSRVVGQ